MIEKTKENYLNRFKDFQEKYLRHCNGEYEAEDLENAMAQASLKLKKSSWVVLRNAVAYSLSDQGNDDAAIFVKNIKYTYSDDTSKPSSGIAHQVSAAEHKKIFEYLFDRIDEQDCPAVMGAVLLAKNLGVRPSEMFSISMLGNNWIKVIGSKKTKYESGEEYRGLDRHINVSEETYKYCKNALVFIHQELEKDNDPTLAMKRIQGRFSTVIKNLFPDNKRNITLYSYRHQMGSNLKASGLGVREVGALMGHRSVESVFKYGNRRTGQAMPLIHASSDSVQMVRVRHNRSPNPQESIGEMIDRLKDENEEKKQSHDALQPS